MTLRTWLLRGAVPCFFCSANLHARTVKQWSHTAAAGLPSLMLTSDLAWELFQVSAMRNHGTCSPMVEIVRCADVPSAAMLALYATNDKRTCSLTYCLMMSSPSRLKTFSSHSIAAAKEWQ